MTLEQIEAEWPNMSQAHKVEYLWKLAKHNHAINKRMVEHVGDIVEALKLIQARG